MGAAILNSVSEFRSVTTEFNRDGEIAVRGKGACLCVSLGNVLGPPRRMDIKTHHKKTGRTRVSTPYPFSDHVSLW
ncbi:unnamed protein product [Arctogadus glacialis]